MTLSNIIVLLFINFVVSYLWHVAITTLFLFLTIYTTKSTQFKSEKIQNLQHKFGLNTNILYYSGCRASPTTFDTLIPFTRPIIIFETTNDSEFVIYHEFSHLKQRHTLKYFILTMFIGSIVSISLSKVVWWENLLIDIISLQILGRFYEIEADKIAIKRCSTEQLFQAISMFNDIKKDRYQQTYLDKFLNLIDVHPTEKQRIHMIKDEIISRKNNFRDIV
jgi:hypothetical protein